MGKRLMIIGAGGVGSVVARKCARLTSVFKEIMLASRTVDKCEAIASDIPEMTLQTAAVDADDVEALSRLINEFKADLLINVALPYQDLPIMEACLATGTHYLDTANYEPKDEAKFEYSWQWAYRQRFADKGLMALLGCGFDPGVTGIFTAHAAKYHFDEIHYLDIVDCNAGDHGQAFATNFNPEINIREITQEGKYFENGEWNEIPAMSIHKPIDYPNIGPRESYLLYHEELESLVKNFPSIKRARFWMTFGQEYLAHLRVLQNVGMTRIDPVRYKGVDIIPLQFLKEVLPEPSSLGENYTGETSIGCQIRGLKDGMTRNYFIYNNCRHQEAYSDVKAQGVSYTTGVPATIGAELMASGVWMKPGVYNVEEMDPDPFLEKLGPYGLPFHEVMDPELPHQYD